MDNRWSMIQSAGGATMAVGVPRTYRRTEVQCCPLPATAATVPWALTAAARTDWAGIGNACACPSDQSTGLLNWTSEILPVSGSVRIGALWSLPIT